MSVFVMKRSDLLLVLAIALPGCGSTGVFKLSTASAPSRPDDCRIETYAAESDLPRKFEKLCVINAETGSTLGDDRTPEGAMAKMRKAACACGADAIILGEVDTKGVSWTGWGSSRVKALAVRFTGPVSDGSGQPIPDTAK